MNRGHDLLVVGLAAGFFSLLLGGIRLWGAWDAWKARRRTAATAAQFEEIVTAETRASFSEIVADLHDVFPEEH
ncbi:hypothetical protein [Microbispora sp. CA-102843]|uniref:hypothetical protein n=1 Tax=Microbispora sp. CA-102843 TaxID=3239952 RepID=UPI003D94676F